MSVTPETRPSENVAGTLLADRACRRCGTNLHGRPMKREEHYALLVVECANCGQVAPCQEYPALGAWPGRWRAISSVLWLVVVVLAFLFSTSVCESVIWPYDMSTPALQKTVATEHYPWYQERSDEFPVESIGARGETVSRLPGSMILRAWWASQDGTEFVRKSGGWVRSIKWPHFGSVVTLAVNSFLVGLFWSVVLSHWKRRWLWGPVILLVVLNWYSMAAGYDPLGSESYGYNFYYGLNSPDWVNATAIADSIVRPVFCVVLTIAGGVFIGTGVMFGRPAARLLIGALLAPRLRGPFSFLWTCDGLKPPVPGARLRRQV